MLFENAVKIGYVVKAGACCNRKDGIVGADQKPFGRAKTLAVGIFAHGKPRFSFKKPAKILFVVVKDVGKLQNRYVISKVGTDIAFYVFHQRIKTFFRAVGRAKEQKHANSSTQL